MLNFEQWQELNPGGTQEQFNQYVESQKALEASKSGPSVSGGAYGTDPLSITEDGFKKYSRDEFLRNNKWATGLKPGSSGTQRLGADLWDYKVHDDGSFSVRNKKDRPAPPPPPPNPVVAREKALMDEESKRRADIAARLDPSRNLTLKPPYDSSDIGNRNEESLKLINPADHERNSGLGNQIRLGFNSMMDRDYLPIYDKTETFSPTKDFNILKTSLEKQMKDGKIYNWSILGKMDNEPRMTSDIEHNKKTIQEDYKKYGYDVDVGYDEESKNYYVTSQKGKSKYSDIDTGTFTPAGVTERNWNNTFGLDAPAFIKMAQSQNAKNTAAEAKDASDEFETAHKKARQDYDREFWGYEDSNGEYIDGIADRVMKQSGGGKGPIGMMANAFGGGVGGYLAAVASFMTTPMDALRMGQLSSPGGRNNQTPPPPPKGWDMLNQQAQYQPQLRNQLASTYAEGLNTMFGNKAKTFSDYKQSKYIKDAELWDSKLKLDSNEKIIAAQLDEKIQSLNLSNVNTAKLSEFKALAAKWLNRNEAATEVDKHSADFKRMKELVGDDIPGAILYGMFGSPQGVSNTISGTAKLLAALGGL